MKIPLQEEPKILSDIYQRCNFSGVEPDYYEEAMNHEEEIWMIEKNNTWGHVAIPREREVVSLKWIYKILESKCILELQSVFYATCKEQWIMG